jgi:hypothetical protein
MPDPLHLIAKSFRIWATAAKGLIPELLKK